MTYKPIPTIASSGLKKASVKDIEGDELLREILQALLRVEAHLQTITDEEIEEVDS